MSPSSRRRLLSACLLSACLLSLALPCAVAAQAVATPSSSAAPAFGVLVKLKPQAPSLPGREVPQQVARERLAQVFSGKSLAMGEVRPVGTGAHWVQWSRPLERAEADRLARELAQDANVEWAVPNVREHRLQVAAPNDTHYGQQWWLSAAPGAGSRGVPNIAGAWQVTTGGDISVAVLDTGLLRSHPDLQGERFTSGYDLMSLGSNGTSNPTGDGDGRDEDFSDPGDGVDAGECGSGEPEEESSWHGTKIAAQIGADTGNSIGVAGINRNVRIVSVRIAGKCGALVSDIVDGMRWAAGLSVSGAPKNPHPVRLINLSFGSSEQSCAPYQDTINELNRMGVLIIAAGGNDLGPVGRPARCPGVLGVGAINRDGFKTVYASLGPQIGITTVGGDTEDGSLKATDGGLYTASNDGTRGPGTNNYGASYGTSFSTPVVAGVASLMLARNPSLTLDQLVHGIKSTARPHVTTSQYSTLEQCDAQRKQGRCYCTTTTCGAGILDAEKALQYAADPSAAPVFHNPDAGSVSDSGGGGGALGWGWLAGLALVAGLAQRSRRAAATA
ncbi:S8 family serine peptidase [Eleftheria terrae]|uniref:S8 family serine peptidase n=1 Tax=Eleftheria terrae TaxID=1597781 RepID=UPI00263BA059|nr:S8 family serine peptidase [Eleftheria terrae]WKB50916.1 S8 family serine peptidase [Eleftheria terrae]